MNGPAHRGAVAPPTRDGSAVAPTPAIGAEAPFSSQEEPLLAGLASNAGAQLAARVAAGMAQAVALVLVARALGPAQYGLLALVTNLTAVATIVMDGGVLLVATRSVASGGREEESVLRNTIGLRLALAVAASLALVGLACAASDRTEVRLGALIASASFLPLAWFGVVQVRAQLAVRLEGLSVAMLLAGLAALGWTVLLLSLGAGVIALASSLVVTGLVSLAAGLALVPGGIPLRPRLDLEVWRGLVRESIPIAVSLTFVTIYFYIDLALLARLSTERQVGLYDAGYRFVQFGVFVPTALMAALYARASEYAARDRPRFSAFAGELLGLVVVLAPLPVVALAVAPEQLLVSLYGEAFADGARALTLLAAGLALMIVSGVVGPLLVALGRERTMLKIGAAAALFNVVVNLLLIPPLAAAGAALATLLTEVLVLVPAAIVLRGEGVPGVRIARLARVAVAGAAGVAVVWLAPVPVLLRIAAGLLVYLGAILATGALGRRELELVRRR